MTPPAAFTIQKISSKENSDFRTSFWAPFLLCCRWFFFLQKKTISGKTRPLKRIMFGSCLVMFVQVSQCHFLLFLFGGGGGNDDTALRQRRDKSEITWPLPHRTQGPNTSWGTPSLRSYQLCTAWPDLLFGRNLKGQKHRREKGSCRFNYELL